MATLTLSCGSNDLIVDASASSVTVNSLGNVGLNITSGKLVIDGAVQFLDAVSGLASLDASGNLSAVSGVPFNTASAYTLTNTWTHSNPVQINSTLGVTGTCTLGGAVLHTGIATISAALGVPTGVPPAGWDHAIINVSTGEIRRMT